MTSPHEHWCETKGSEAIEHAGAGAVGGGSHLGFQLCQLLLVLGNQGIQRRLQDPACFCDNGPCLAAAGFCQRAQCSVLFFEAG
jgi:hypothetical protein